MVVDRVSQGGVLPSPQLQVTTSWHSPRRLALSYPESVLRP